jgi:ABC-type Na+ transport system ATPase subunit NatA
MRNEGGITVLLGSRGFGKTDMLLSIAGQKRWDDGNVRPLYNETSIQLCSKQGLLPSHLNVREIMKLAAAFHGLDDRERIKQLLEIGGMLGDSEKKLVYYLPRYEARILSLLWSLMPDPDILLIDDLADGLSLPARRKLWRFILDEQDRQPRSVLYATQDVEAARTLGDEIWLRDGENRFLRWAGAEIPAAFYSLARYAFVMKSAQAADNFYKIVSSEFWVEHCIKRDLKTIDVLVSDANQIVDLTRMAGFGLREFQSLPLDIEQIATILDHSDVSVESVGFHSRAGPSQGTKTTLNYRQMVDAIFCIEILEWQQHFRKFLKFANLIITAVVLLSIIQIAIILLPDRCDDFFCWAPAMLLPSSTMALGLGMQAVSQLIATGETANLFQKAQPKSRERPFSTLLMYDLTAIGRRSLLLGMVLSQYLVLMMHSWPLLLLLFGGGYAYMLDPSLLGTGLLYWGITSLAAMALVVILGSLLKRPGTGIWLGWVLWPVLALSSLFSPVNLEPYSWLWPFTGFTIAFRELDNLRLPSMPLGLAVMGTLILCIMATAVFCSRSAVWEGRKGK